MMLRMLIVILCLAAKPIQAENVEAGKEIFLKRCGMCHEYPEPARLNKNQWKAVLKKMQKRMQFVGMIPLTESENEQVFRYLQDQAKPGP